MDGAAVLLEERSDAPFLEIDELRNLVADGRERGYLTYEEIASCLEEVEVTKEQVRGLHAHLLETGVEVVSKDDRAAIAAHDEATAAPRGGEPAAKKEPDIDLTVEPSLDSLRLYLRSI